jgi:hypothetical protein
VIDGFYSRTLVFLQSSGVGKSRLADTFGQVVCPMINYVLREKGAAGFPPADDEILLLMRQFRSTLCPPARSNVWYHSLAVGVLQASFEELHKWIEQSSQSPTHLKDLADLRHKEMAYNFEPEGMTYRPEKRIKFCQDVAKRAKDIAVELMGNKPWRQVFDSRDSAIRYSLTHKMATHLRGLWNAAETLTKFLGSLKPENGYDPLLVVVFDKASSLLKEPGEKEPGEKESSPGRYIALNRIMSCLREYRIWFFIISTESQVGDILPPDEVPRPSDYEKDSSLRFALPASETGLKRIPPFLAFPLNIEDVEAMQDSKQELSKKLSEFGTQRHMAMFGRRLWYAYIDDPQGMDTVAKKKLLGGVQIYNAQNVDHVFAALSFRLSLDACLYNPQAVHLVQNAVNSHMRVVLATDQRAGIMNTVAPSEPIIAVAAMKYLCTKSNWTASIDTLTELIEKGVVEKGLKGELYARLMLTLAHDWIRKQADRESQEADSDGEPQEDEGLHSDPYFLTTFTVKEFLTTLYGEERHKSIMNIDETILHARMNFNHFVPTHKNLCSEVLSGLLVDLLRRSAALQLCPGQPTYDILIPIYFGDENLPLNPSECGCIVVQVNKDTGSTPSTLLGEEFTDVEAEGKATEDSDSIVQSPKRQKTSKSASSNAKTEKAPEDASTDAKKKNPKEPIRNGPYFLFQEMKRPILYLLFDLCFARKDSPRAPAIEVSYTSKEEDIPRVWAIHSRGHDEKVFGCLGLMRCEDASYAFFKALALDSSRHDQEARRNDCFYELNRRFRYPSETEGTENSKTQSGVEGVAGHGSKRKAEENGTVMLAWKS